MKSKPKTGSKKAVKGWIYKDFAEKGWRGKDSAIFFYRKMDKVSRYNTFIPVKMEITYQHKGE
jgi:hypothetical protein